MRLEFKVTARARQSRQLIIDTACDAVAHHGGRQPTVVEVCERAGISRRTFYRHFEGIADVLERGVLESWTLMRADLLALRPQDDLVLTAAALTAVLRYVTERSLRSEGMIFKIGMEVYAIQRSGRYIARLRSA